MKTISRLFYTMGACGLVGAVIMTLISPSVIKVLFTPPVSFGTNCEPAASWSIESFIKMQTSGLVIGMFVGIVSFIYFLKRKKEAQAPSA